MEAALRDYSNSFNSLQSVSQVRHPIILLRPPFGEEEGGGRGALCSSQLLPRVTCALCCRCSWRDTCLLDRSWQWEVLWMQGLHSSVRTHLRYSFSLPCWLHGGIYTSQLGASQKNASIAAVFVSGRFVLSRWTLQKNNVSDGAQSTCFLFFS